MRYRPDRAGTAAFLRSREVKELLTEAAQDGVQYGIARSPRVSGRYQRSFDIQPSVGWDGRAAVNIANMAPYARDVEAKHHVLASIVEYIERR